MTDDIFEHNARVWDTAAERRDIWSTPVSSDEIAAARLGEVAVLLFTVEPLLLTGGPRFHQADDGWTEHVDDNRPSAQFEHTVVVTERGADILTIIHDGQTAVGTLGDLTQRW